MFKVGLTSKDFKLAGTALESAKESSQAAAALLDVAKDATAEAEQQLTTCEQAAAQCEDLEAQAELRRKQSFAEEKSALSTLEAAERKRAAVSAKKVIRTPFL